jgi:hypothetical protein
MHHQRITLTSSPLLQRQQPIWCLCPTRRDTTSRRCMRTMLFCHSGPKRCLEEVKIAPTNPTFLELIGHGVTSSHTALSAGHTRHWNHTTNRENFKPWTNWWYGFSARRGWLMALWFFVEDTAKTDAASDSRVTMGERLVWGQISDPNVNQDTVGKLWSRAFLWCNKNAKVPMWNNTLIISKDTKYCW